MEKNYDKLLRDLEKSQVKGVKDKYFIENLKLNFEKIVKITSKIEENYEVSLESAIEKLKLKPSQ